MDETSAFDIECALYKHQPSRHKIGNKTAETYSELTTGLYQKSKHLEARLFKYLELSLHFCYYFIRLHIKGKMLLSFHYMYFM